MTIGNRLANLRRAKGWSQEYVAELVGVSRQAVSKWEQDRSAPDTYNLIALARLYGVSVEYIAVGEAEGETLDSATPQDRPVPPPPPAPSVRDPQATRRVVGYILLAVGLAGMLAGLLVEAIMVILGGFLVLGGTLCLTVRRHLGLVLTWVFWSVCNGLIVFMTGVLLPLPSVGAELNMSQAFMLLLVAWLMVNVIVTVCFFVCRKRARK